MLLTNPTTGQVLPVFVFYSVLPYLPATFLNLLGMPACRWRLRGEYTHAPITTPVSALMVVTSDDQITTDDHDSGQIGRAHV